MRREGKEGPAFECAQCSQRLESCCVPQILLLSGNNTKLLPVSHKQFSVIRRGSVHLFREADERTRDRYYNQYSGTSRVRNQALSPSACVRVSRDGSVVVAPISLLSHTCYKHKLKCV